MLAAANSHIEAVRILVEAGADVNVREAWNHGKAKNLSGAMLEQFQSSENAENTEDAERARRPDRGEAVRIHGAVRFDRVDYNV